MNERRRQPGIRQEKGRRKKKNPLADSNYFYIEESIPCTCNAVCVHVTCKVVTVHAICEGLFTDDTPLFSTVRDTNAMAISNDD